MRHINFFFWGPKWGVVGVVQKVYVENVYLLLPSLKIAILGEDEVVMLGSGDL